MKTKSAMITIAGRPNVGKSTLTNYLVGEKIAIVSNKPDAAVKTLCARYFPGIYARGESTDCPRKPAPDMVFKAMEEIGAGQAAARYRAIAAAMNDPDTLDKLTEDSDSWKFELEIATARYILAHSAAFLAPTP